MASRGNREFQESDEETEDEDYSPDEDESEEDYEQMLADAEELLELGLLPLPAVGRDPRGELGESESESMVEGEGEVEGEGVGEGEDDDVEVVTEMGCSTSRVLVCDENSVANEGQLGTCSDPSCPPCCPICFVPWTSDGPHRVCCIPCGHVYGRSCLERWIKQCKSTTAKCPQCSATFKKNGMINLYAPIIAVANSDMEKEVLSLREKNESLKLERDLLMEEINRSKKMACLEVGSSGPLKRSSRHLDEDSFSFTDPLFENRFTLQNNLNINGCNHCRCTLQYELPLDAARVLGIDAASQFFIVSGKKPGQSGEHILSKISLLGQHEIDQIQLPPQTGAVRDLCTLPGSLALIASLGKKLSVLSMLSNNIVLKYDLPVPAWSCSGDVNEPYHIYAGLQNGILLVFDIRQTARWLESIEGLSRFPIHTICSLRQTSCSRRVLTASSVGPCLWAVGGSGERPILIPELESQGICISLACGSSSSSDIVASFRPKIELYNSATPSQTPASPSQPLHLSGRLGSHVNIKWINDTHFQKGSEACGYVSEVRMSKSAVICTEGNNPLFAFGDESTHGVCLWGLPSFQAGLTLFKRVSGVNPAPSSRKPNKGGRSHCLAARSRSRTREGRSRMMEGRNSIQSLPCFPLNEGSS